MKSRFTALLAAVILLIFSVIMVGCNDNNKPNDPVDPPEGPTKEFVELTFSDFHTKSEEFLTITNYMSLLGVDFEYSDSFYNNSLKASLDMSLPENLMLGVEYAKGDDCLKVHLGNGRLYAFVSRGDVEKKDSMKLNNNLTELMSELKKGSEGLTGAFEYLFASLKDEMGESGSFFDKDSIEKTLEKCTFLYYGDERMDEYKILANHSFEDNYYKSSVPYDVFVEFKVSSGCIISLNGTIQRDNGKTEFSFERRSYASDPIELPTEVYSGDLLDDFEELYLYRAVTIKDFIGEWTGDGYTLIIGDSVKLVTPDGEVELTIDNLTANYLTLVTQEAVYIAHLTDKIELILPNSDEAVILNKVE